VNFVYDDGGRAEAGFEGEVRDCVARSFAIATETPYTVMYNLLNAATKVLNQVDGRSHGNARKGVSRKTRDYVMEHLGWEWIPLVKVGVGCKVHLREEELPKGRIVARVSKHCVAVIDGVVHDTYDPSQGGTRCVYGIYRKKETA